MRSRHAASSSRGFTFVEILAAMLFMAIVIPVAVQGIMIANRAGAVAQRKRVATQLADRLLAETILTESWRDGDSEGDFGEDWPRYRWALSTDYWSEDETMRCVRVQVFYVVQEQEYNVQLETLAVDAEGDSEATE